MMFFLGIVTGLLVSILLFQTLIVPTGKIVFPLGWKILLRMLGGKNRGAHFLTRFPFLSRTADIILIGLTLGMCIGLSFLIGPELSFSISFTIGILVASTVRNNAAETVARLDEEWVASYIQELNAQNPVESLPAYQELMTSDDRNLRLWTMKYMEYHPVFIPLLQSQMSDPDFEIRRLCTALLTQNEPALIGSYLKDLILSPSKHIPDPNPKYYFEHIRYLPEQDHKEVALGLLQRHAPVTRTDAKELIQKGELRLSLEEWREAVGHISRLVRYYAIRHLAQEEDLDAIPLIMEQLKSEIDISELAVDAIDKLLFILAGNLKDGQKNEPQKEIRLRKYGEDEPLPALPPKDTSTLLDEQDRLRLQKHLLQLSRVLPSVPIANGRAIVQSIKIFKKYKYKEAGEMLFRHLMGNQNSGIQDECASALAALWSPTQFIEHLHIPHSDANVRLGLMKALALRMKDDPFTPFPELKAYLGDRSPTIRNLALSIVLKYGEADFETLITCLMGSEKDIRNAVLDKIGTSPDTKYLPHLFRLYESYDKKNSIFKYQDKEAYQDSLGSLLKIEQVIIKIMDRNRPVLNAYPKVYCETCLCPAIDAHELKWSYVTCPVCHCDRNVTLNADTIIGVIDDRFFLKMTGKNTNLLEVGLWNEAEKKTRSAVVEQLLIRKTDRDIHYDWAVNAVCQMLKDRLLSDKKIPIRIEAGVLISDNSKLMLQETGYVITD